MHPKVYAYVETDDVHNQYKFPKSKHHMVHSKVYINPLPRVVCVYLYHRCSSWIMLLGLRPSYLQWLPNIKDKSLISHSAEAEDTKCPLSAPMGLTNRINSM